MRYIKRGDEPQALALHRATIKGPITSAHYKNLPKGVRPAIERQLSKEQGHLCGYCMTRLRVIKPDYLMTEEEKREPPRASRVDHWMPRKLDPELSLTWTNFVLACPGSESADADDSPQAKSPLEFQTHCDVRKHEAAITLNPLKQVIEDQLRYAKNGRVEGTDKAPTTADADLNKTLNLNAPHLMRNRARVLDELARWVQQKKFTATQMKNEIGRWGTPNAQGELREYCGVVVWQLRRWLKRA